MIAFERFRARADGLGCKNFVCPQQLHKRLFYWNYLISLADESACNSVVINTNLQTGSVFRQSQDTSGFQRCRKYSGRM